MSEFESPGGGFERALDRALSRTLQPPRVSRDFRRCLHAALSRAGEADLSQLRSRLESERQAHLATLEAHYVRLRRWTLAAMIGAAFAAGAAATVALPWLERHVAEQAPLVLTSAGAAVSLAIAFLSWRAYSRGGAV
ncbi:MAG TPA: hypothetical protein VGT07_05430 [Steroidobacteraceae bacterium]|nr:hypothetical protein [Steroidobacteraceae bacterium]